MTVYYYTKGYRKGAQMKNKVERTLGIQGIGKLEAEIFAMICEDFKKPVTVRDIYEAMRLKRKIAYTTVMSVMNALTAKKLTKQNKSEMAYTYTPRISNHQLALKLMNNISTILLRKELKDIQLNDCLESNN